MAIAPVIRHMLLCDQVLSDAATGKITLVGLISSIEPNTSPAYPYRLPRLAVFIQLTNGRGQPPCKSCFGKPRPTIRSPAPCRGS